jgi:hypothetical protein
VPQEALAAGTQNRIASSPEREEVSRIKKKEAPGVKRMNLNVPIELHNSFKAATAALGLDMTTVLLEFIESYVSKQGTTPSKKRRA